MSNEERNRHPPGKHRYRSVVEGMALANEFARSRQSIAEFARDRGVSYNMVKYWSTRARRRASASGSSLVEVAEVSSSGEVKPIAGMEPLAREPVATGRKSWLFVASEDGGTWAADLLSVFRAAASSTSTRSTTWSGSCPP